jgi:hypothetical protein
MTKLLMVILGVSFLANIRAQAEDRLNLVVAVDLTRSVVVAEPDGKSDFQKNLDGVTRLLSQVPPDSHVTVIGITDHSLTQPHILLSVHVPDDAGYFGERLNAARSQLVRMEVAQRPSRTALSTGRYSWRTTISRSNIRAATGRKSENARHLLRYAAEHARLEPRVVADRAAIPHSGQAMRCSPKPPQSSSLRPRSRWRGKVRRLLEELAKLLDSVPSQRWGRATKLLGLAAIIGQFRFPVTGPEQFTALAPAFSCTLGITGLSIFLLSSDKYLSDRRLWLWPSSSVCFSASTICSAIASSISDRSPQILPKTVTQRTRVPNASRVLTLLHRERNGSGGCCLMGCWGSTRC